MIARYIHYTTHGALWQVFFENFYSKLIQSALFSIVIFNKIPFYILFVCILSDVFSQQSETFCVHAKRSRNKRRPPKKHLLALKTAFFDFPHLPTQVKNSIFVDFAHPALFTLGSA
ncbi:MAG: hypothetical protein IKB87_04445 [Clostridia bacterium]|nr:hypothetical protein [Clostridia bacterium]